MANIYDYINDVQTDIREYEEMELSEVELKKYKKHFQRKIRPRKLRKYMTAAACIVLCMTALAAGPFRTQVVAALTSASEAMNEYLFWGGDVRNYETVINKEKKDDGIGVKLESVVMDRHRMLISTVQTYPKKTKAGTKISIRNRETNGWGLSTGNLKELKKEVERDTKSGEFETYGYPLIAGDVEVNGEKLNGYAIVRMTEWDNRQVRVLYEYEFINTIDSPDKNKELEVKMNFEEITGISNGKWKFAFKADGQELYEETAVVNLTQEITLPDDNTITLNEYAHNSLGTRIYFESKNKVSYTLMLKGTDDQGRIVEFEGISITDDKGLLSLAGPNEIRAKDAKSMTLQLYAKEKNKESRYEPVGEMFTIDTK